MSILDFDEREALMDESLAFISVFDVHKESRNVEAADQATVWNIQTSPTSSFFVGTQSDQNHYDIHYRYNLLFDIGRTLESDEVQDRLHEVPANELEDLRDKVPSLYSEIELSISDLIQEGFVDLQTVANLLDTNIKKVAEQYNIEIDDYSGGEYSQAEGINNEEISESNGASRDHADEGVMLGEQGDTEEMTDYEKDWIAAYLRLSSISDKSHAKLIIHLSEILSEGPLAYDVEITDSNRVHKFKLAHRFFPEEDQINSQELYESIRLVKSSGDYAKDYLRYAFRLQAELGSTSAEGPIDFPGS